MIKPSVYIETSIISYLASRPSSNLITAACQQITAHWWESKRTLYNLFSSELVIAEARIGDSDQASKRLELLRGIPELNVSNNVKQLAATFIAKDALPDKAQADALHIAIAAVHEMEYLLTWNCRYIDNPSIKPVVRALCVEEGFQCPEICTPIEIMEVGHDGE